jgi:hypothetical protein
VSAKADRRDKEMQTYREYQPTGFDAKGLGLHDRQDWIVAPVGRNRDSEVLSNVNFETALEMLGGESETVEVHRFGHWGPGWFEIILVSPERAQDVEEIEGALENYPVLDESKLSEKENEEYYHNWTNAGACSDFRRELIRKCRPEEKIEDWLYDVDKDVLLQFFESLIPSGEFHTGDCWPNTRYAIDKCTREDFATFVRENMTAA